VDAVAWIVNTCGKHDLGLLGGGWAARWVGCCRHVGLAPGFVGSWPSGLWWCLRGGGSCKCVRVTQPDVRTRGHGGRTAKTACPAVLPPPPHHASARVAFWAPFAGSDFLALPLLSGLPLLGFRGRGVIRWFSYGPAAAAHTMHMNGLPCQRLLLLLVKPSLCPVCVTTHCTARAPLARCYAVSASAARQLV
jgi:hypothetical protein